MASGCLVLQPWLGFSMLLVLLLLAGVFGQEDDMDNGKPHGIVLPSRLSNRMHHLLPGQPAAASVQQTPGLQEWPRNPGGHTTQHTCMCMAGVRVCVHGADPTTHSLQQPELLQAKHATTITTVVMAGMWLCWYPSFMRTAVALTCRSHC